MESIWLDSCNKLEISDEIAKKWLEKIETKLSTESSRFYHNWDNLLLKRSNYLSNVSPSVVLALVFQYYEFDVKRNCVDENCKVFIEFCKDADLTEETTVKRIRKLIGDHTVEDVPQYGDDADVLQDLNLIVLGSSEDEYKSYTTLIRKEYSHLDDAAYNKMRLKILQTFLTIPTIFSTAIFRDQFESLARSNIKSEIEDLKN